MLFLWTCGKTRVGISLSLVMLLSICGYAIAHASLQTNVVVVVRVENHVTFTIQNAKVWVEENLMPKAAGQQVSVVQQPVDVATSIEPGKAAEGILSIAMGETISSLDLPVTLGWKTSRDGDYPFYLTKRVTVGPSVVGPRVSFHIDETSCTRRLESAGPLLRGPPSYEIHPGTVSIQGSGIAVAAPAASLVYVLVMSSIWSSISDRVWRYANDLSVTYSVSVWTYSGNSKIVVRNWLSSERAQHSNLVGCLFVGDVPEAWYEIPAHSGWGAETFPIDLYYMDLDGIWSDADGDGVFDSHIGNRAPEIWIGRLKASNIGNEVLLISRYFDKDHAYRIGQLSVPYRALSYVDDDWKDCYDRAAVGEVYRDTTLVNDIATTTAADYRNRLAQGYEWVHLMCHGWPGGHTFKIGSDWTGGTVYSSEYFSSDWPVLFFNFFVCSGARYTDSGYLAGSAVFPTNHGLLGIGSTKTGSMTNFFEFYRPLSNKMSVGAALMAWWKTYMDADWFVDWSYGLTIIGDPTLTIQKPWASIISPSGWLRGTVTLTATAGDPDGYVVRVRFIWTPDKASGPFYVIGDDTNGADGWSIVWDCGGPSNNDASVWVAAVALDNSGFESDWSWSNQFGVDHTAPTGGISINSGATYATSMSVTLTLSATDGSGSGVGYMRFSNDGSSWSSWYSYGTSMSWSLMSGDGTKTVYAQFKDNVGLISSTYSDTIVLDTTPPAGSITINAGATYATSASVTLTLSASDTNGVAQMRFSNDGSTWSSWYSYGTSASWTLASGDGTKTVYVQFKDNAGLVSPSYSDTIILDTTAPTGSISINAGATYATSASVTLTLSASDTNGVAQMRFSNDGSTWSSWYSYGTSMSWSLMSGDGTKTVYAQFKDNVGLISSTYSDTIVLDTTPPVGSISINGGAAYTKSTSVSLTLTYTDATSGVSQVRYSNDGVWDTEPWENPSGTKSWTLTTGEGPKTVYYQIKDNAGLTSTFSATITLDTLAPSAPTLLSPSNGTVINSLVPTFSWQPSADATSGVLSYTLQIDTSADFTSTNLRTITGITSTSYPFTTPLTYATWYWRVKAFDKAGNEGAFSAYWSIIIDRVRVTATISTSTTTSTTGTSYTSTSVLTTQRSTTNTTVATSSCTTSYTTTTTLYSGSTSTTYTVTTTFFSTSTSVRTNTSASTTDSVGIVTRTSKTGTATVIQTYSTSTTSVDTIYVRITVHSTFIEQFLETVTSTLTRLISELIQFVHNIFVTKNIWDTTVIVEPERGTCWLVLDASPKPGYVNKPVTISGVMYGSWRCIRDGMVVGKPVTITADWGFNTVVSTDYYGRFSVTTNCPATAGTYPITATFYEDQDLRGNSTSILYEVTAKIPTSITISYIGNREFGGYLRRQDTGGYLAYMPVRLTVTYLSGTTWQTSTYDLQTRQDGYWNLEFLFYWNKATIMFEGDETYASCSATLSRGGGSSSGMSSLVSMAANGIVRAEIKASAIRSEATSRIVLDASPKPGYINKPVNISGVMYGSWRCIRDGMVVGKPVEVVTGWGFSTVLTTDYYGKFSVATDCPAAGGTYPITATFYEDQDLTGSSTTISYDVIAKIPTTLTISYVGNREFGGYLRRVDTGAYLAYKPVKLTVTYLSGTTWRTDSFDLQTRQDGYYSLEFLFYWNSATISFEGDETYAPSSATITR